MAKTTGHNAEQLACSFLQNHGLSTVSKNFRCRRGEIDLIMQHHNTLVFVEVRYRKNSNYGSAIESVTKNKQRKITMAASYFLTQQQMHDMACRFDIVAISGSTMESIEWVTNAFEPDLY